MQVEGCNGKDAEKDARHRVESFRDPVPPGSPRNNAALKLTLHNRLSEKAALMAFRARMREEGRLFEAELFRDEARRRLAEEHSAWDDRRCLHEAWMATFREFPSYSSLGFQGPDLAATAATAAIAAERTDTEDREAAARSQLLKVALVSSDRGGIQDDTEWVYQNLAVPWDQIPVETVPSPGSVALLGEAKADKKWFLEKYHAKLLPTKSKNDSDGWFEADDNQVAEMCARIREENAMLAQGGAEQWPSATIALRHLCLTG